MVQVTPRSALPLYAAVLFGLATLLAGLVALGHMLVSERRDALANQRRERELLVAAVAGEWRASVETQMKVIAARIEEASQDPLAPCPDCYLYESGVQRWPLSAAKPIDVDSPRSPTVKDWYADATAGSLVENGVRDAEWQRRLALLSECRRAPQDTITVDAVLKHQAAFILLARQDIAASLAIFARCTVPASLAGGLLRDGIRMPSGRPIEGLEAAVIRHAGQLTSTELEFVREHVVELARTHSVPTDEFLSALDDLVAPGIELPRNVKQRVIAARGGSHWYIEPTPLGARGYRFDLQQTLTNIASGFRGKNLLGDGDHLRATLDGPSVPIETVRVDVRAQRIVQSQHTISRRFAWKVTLVAICGILGISLAGFGVALQRRRHRNLVSQALMVAQVSHELRTPLASMRVIAETLDRRVGSLPEARDYPARLLRDIDGMTLLVDNTLSYERLR
jgi:hypothetical protein